MLAFSRAYSIEFDVVLTDIYNLAWSKVNVFMLSGDLALQRCLILIVTIDTCCTKACQTFLRFVLSFIPIRRSCACIIYNQYNRLLYCTWAVMNCTSFPSIFKNCTLRQFPTMHELRKKKSQITYSQYIKTGTLLLSQ